MEATTVSRTHGLFLPSLIPSLPGYQTDFRGMRGLGLRFQE